MRTPPTIINALMPRTRQVILAATLMKPDQAWYAANLARHLGLSRSSLQRELLSLIKVGILKSRREGRMRFVQANSESPVFADLRGLISKTVGLVDVLRSALSPFKTNINMCFVFGSIARTEQTSTSDVDLFIIGNIDLQDIASSLREAQKTLGRELNPKLFRLDEFTDRLASKDYFVLNVLAKPKLFVMGSPDELDRITQRKARRGTRVQQN